MSANRVKSHSIPLLLFLLSFLLRLSLISKGPYHLDCLNLAVLAEKTLETHTLQNLFGPGYPLTILLGAFFIFISRIFSQNDPVASVNLMSVVFSSLSVPVLYYIAHKLFDRTTALLSSALFSITPIFLGISVYGKSHTPSIFFLLTAIHFLLCFLDTREKRNLLLSSIFMGLMGAARLQDMIFMILPVSFLCIFGTDQDPQRLTKKEAVQNLLKFWGAALTIVILFHLPYLAPQHHTQISYIHNLSQFLEQVSSSFGGALSNSLIISVIYLLKSFTEAGFIISIIGLIFFARKSPRIFFFFLLWVIGPFLFYGSLYGTVPRFFAFLLPPLMIAQGYIFSRLIKINFAFRAISLIVYLTIINLLSASIFPLYVRHSYSFLPDYVRWIAGKIENNAYLITTDDRPFYIYYSRINVMGKPLQFLSLEDKELETFKQKLDGLLDSNIPVYITSVGLFAYDPGKKFSSLIRRNYNLDVIGGALYEDWHRGVLKQVIIYNYLMRITKKEAGHLTLQQK